MKEITLRHPNKLNLRYYTRAPCKKCLPHTNPNFVSIFLSIDQRNHIETS